MIPQTISEQYASGLVEKMGLKAAKKLASRSRNYKAKCVATEPPGLKLDVFKLELGFWDRILEALNKEST